MELQKCRLCLDCEWVDVYQDCPKCGSKATHLLVNFLSEERLFVAKEEEKDVSN